MSFHFAFVDVSPGLVAEADAKLLGLIVARLDAHCPDPLLRPFGHWSSTTWQTSEMFAQGLSPVFRVSVRWPELEANQ